MRLTASYLKIYVYNLLEMYKSGYKYKIEPKIERTLHGLILDTKKEQKIKAQEWVVMFDGQIKKSEKEIDSDEHHLEVINQNNEGWLAFKCIGQIRQRDI